MSNSSIDLDSMRALLREFESTLHAFAQSSSTIKLLRSIPPSSPPSAGPAPRTLIVLDSSFNPPTKAHAALATTALLSDHGPDPKRLLLLLATQNADKAPQPASFAHRLVLMTLFAQDLLRRTHFPPPVPAIDIGVTKAAIFIDKAFALDESGIYPSPTPQQVHLVGYDTYVRLLDPKYYPPTHTLAPLGPFLTKHRLRVTLRTDDKWGGREEQEKEVRRLVEGGREDQGGLREWARNVQVVDPVNAEEKVAVSSTKVREAAKKGDGEALRKFVCEDVARWVESEGLYKE